MTSNRINLIVSYPIYFLIKAPILCDTGLDGQAFANASSGDRLCVAMFHDQFEAEKFVSKFGLRGASICKCDDEEQFVLTLRRCKSKFGYEYACFPTTKEDGSFHVVRIDELHKIFSKLSYRSKDNQE